jgi:hypothetical protein
VVGNVFPARFQNWIGSTELLAIPVWLTRHPDTIQGSMRDAGRLERSR